MQNVDGFLTLMANDPSWRHLMANAPSWRHLMANDPINEKCAQRHVCTGPKAPCTRHAKWRKANRNKNVDGCLTLMANDPSWRHTSSDDQASSSSVQCPSLGRVSGAPKLSSRSRLTSQTHDHDPINEKGAQNHVWTGPKANWRKANRNKNVDGCLTLMANDPSWRHTSSDDQASSSSVQCPSLGRVSGAPKLRSQSRLTSQTHGQRSHK